MTPNTRITVFYCIFMSIHGVFCIPLSFKEGVGIAPLNPPLCSVVEYAILLL